MSVRVPLLLKGPTGEFECDAWMERRDNPDNSNCAYFKPRLINPPLDVPDYLYEASFDNYHGWMKKAGSTWSEFHY